MSNYQDLTYDAVVFKGSHNSYERDESLSKQLEFKSEGHIYNCGCRAVELDIWRHSANEINEGYFTVDHLSSGEGERLVYYFDELIKWHNDNKNHDPVLVHLDIKSEDGDYSVFPNEIDSYISKYFGAEKCFTPSMIIKNRQETLQQIVMREHWPKISEMRNKFIFCLSGNADWKKYYSEHNLGGCLCFADKEIPGDDKNYQPPTDGNILFFNIHIYDKNHSDWSAVIPRFRGKNLIVRAYKVNSEDNWTHCINAGTSILATDKVSNYKWAYVSGEVLFGNRK